MTVLLLVLVTLGVFVLVLALALARAAALGDEHLRDHPTIGSPEDWL